MASNRTDDRKSFLAPVKMERSTSESSALSETSQTSYDGRLVIPMSEDYSHQTYADPTFNQARVQIKFNALVKRNEGLLLVALSQIFFAGMNVFAKLLANPTNPEDPPISTFQLIFVRMSITYLFAVCYMWYTQVPDWLLGPEGVRGLLLLRATSGFFGLFSIYYSLQYLPLSEATVLTFLAPCCTLFFGWLFLGEGFSYKEALAGLVALFGVVVIARPLSLIRGDNGDGGGAEGATTEAERLSAVLVSLLGVVGAGGAYVTIRYIGKRAHALISVSAFSFFGSVYAAMGLIFTGQSVVMPSGTRIIYLVALGLSGFVAQFLMTLGLQREKAGRGASATYLQMFFAV